MPNAKCQIMLRLAVILAGLAALALLIPASVLAAPQTTQPASSDEVTAAKDAIAPPKK